MHRVSKVVKLQVVKVDSLHEKKSFLKSLVLTEKLNEEVLRCHKILLNDSVYTFHRRSSRLVLAF